MKKIVFTGGGSAGHVVPNVALAEELSESYELFYIGTSGIEKRLISPLKIPYGEIRCPKFIRGFSLKNLSIPTEFCRAVKSAKKILEDIQPDLVFSKGGYVALPVITAAKQLNIPCLTHESDLSLGLANRLMAKKCKYVLTSFPETADAVTNGLHTGSPMRRALFGKNKDMARAKYGFNTEKPVLLVLGGGSGSAAINEALRKNLFSVCRDYYVLHLCGRGNLSDCRVAGYEQREFEPDMGSAYACADVVAARAGSNTVFEVLALKKSALFIPLENARSRGDQVKNAEYFQRRGLCRILREKDLNCFQTAIRETLRDNTLKKNLSACDVSSGNERIIECIREFL